MKTNKAQIRLGETIAVLIIFFFLLVLGAGFYMNYAKRSSVAAQSEYYEKESIMVSQIVSFLPEVQCSRQNIVEDNCYDILKVEAASQKIYDNSDYYYPLFGYATVKIQEIYPESHWWTLYNHTPTFNGETHSAGVIPTYFPISLYDPIKKNYRFGILFVEYIAQYD